MNGMYQDIWNSDFFGFVSMTDAITKKEYVPSEFETLVPWQVNTSATDEFALDIVAGRVQTLPITARDAQLPTLAREARGVEKFPIPRWGQEANILNSQIRGVRDTGTTNMRMLAGVRSDALQSILDNVNKTNNLHMCRAFDGLVQDPVSGQILCNTHVKMRTRQAFYQWDFGNNNLDPNSLLKGVKRFIRDKLGKANMSAMGLILACGERFYIALMALPKVIEAFKSWSEKTDALRFTQADRDLPFPFVLGGSVIVEDLSDARIDGGGNGFIDDDCAYVLPIVPGMYRCMVGPSDLTQFENNPLPYYATQGPLGDRGFEIGIKVRGETVRMYYVTRADAICKIEGLNIANDNTFLQDVQYYANAS